MERQRNQGITLVVFALISVFVAGCGSSGEEFVITDSGVPVASNDEFTSLANKILRREAPGVLANDLLNGATITDFDAVVSEGGTLQLRADGSFVYNPVFGFEGRETFEYTLSGGGGVGVATMAVTSNGNAFFVDNTASGGNGDEDSPFSTLAQALNAAGSGDTIFVQAGDGTNRGLGGAFTLRTGVSLRGIASGEFASRSTDSRKPTLTRPVTCLGGNRITGLHFESSAGGTGLGLQFYRSRKEQSAGEGKSSH